MPATKHQHDPRGSYGESKADLTNRLKKIEGQIRGVQRMIDQETYCVDVLTQLSAVIAGCEKVALKVLEEHIRGCVAEAVASDSGQEKIEELNEVLRRFLKSGSSPVAKA